MSKTASLTIDSPNGNYTIGIDAKRSRLPVTKEVRNKDGDMEERTMFIPMEQVKVTLLHKSGDVVEYKRTAMGRKVTWSRIYNGCGGVKIINREATGEALLERLNKAESVGQDRVLAALARCTGLSLKAAADLFDAAALTFTEAAHA